MRNSLRYIINANEYDFLIRIQHYMLFRGCIIDALTGKVYNCYTVSPDMEDCKKCIQKWLNEDETESNYSEKV